MTTSDKQGPTRGPWRVAPRGLIEGRSMTQIMGPNGWLADAIDAVSVSEAEANARLIAAAPDMLEALREMVMSINYEHDGQMNDLYGVSKAIAAIAKAIGETVQA